MNFRLRYTSTDTGRIWQVTVTDDEDTSGKYRDLKGTTEITYSHTNSDERIPYSSPINTGELRFGVWIDEVPFDNIHQEEVYNDFEDVSDVSLISPCNEGRADELDVFTDIEDLKGDDDQPQNIIDSMAGSDDLRYQVSLQYKDDPNDPFTTEWRGHIIPDLTIYQEDSKPYRATFIARDFSVLSGDYAPGAASQAAKTISVVFANLLDDFGLNRPFKAVTPFINAELTRSECYLHQTLMSTYQLQDGIADDDRVFISKREALERLLRNHNMVLFQSDGYFWLVNMSAMKDADNVLVTEYDTSGNFVSDSYDDHSQEVYDTVFGYPNLSLVCAANITGTGTLRFFTDVEDLLIGEDLSTTLTIKTSSTVSISPAIKTVTTKYQHNGTIYGLSFTDSWTTNSITATSKVFSGVFLSTGEQTITFSGQVQATASAKVFFPEASVRVQAGQYYWDGAQWTTSATDLSFPLPFANDDLPDVDGQYSYYTNIAVSTSVVPDDLTSDLLTITFFNPTHSTASFLTGQFTGFIFGIAEEEEFPENEINYRESNDGDISVNYDIGTIYYGDKVTVNSKSGFKRTSVDFLIGGWYRRGETLESSFQRLLILDILNFYKDTKDLIQVDTVSNYLPWQTIEYKNKNYFCTSSSCNLYTGQSRLTMIETAVSTDTTEGIIEVPGLKPIREIAPLTGAIIRSNYITPSGELKANVTIQSGGSSGTLSSQLQNLNDDGVLTRDETTDDANVYRPAPSAVTLSAGTYNNYALIDGANIFIGGAGAKILTGIVADAGREVTITCAQGTLQLNNLDTNSSSSNQFAIAGAEDMILRVGDSVTLSHQFNLWYVKNNYVRSNQVNPVIELTALTNDADDYAIGDGTFFSVAMGAFYSGNDITGFAGGVDGREIEIINRGTDAIDIQHQNSGSLVTNRIISPTGADIILNQYDTVRLRYYEGTINRWVIVGGTY